MTNTLPNTAAHNLASTQEYISKVSPLNAPEEIDDDCDARGAWADGWNACLYAVNKKSDRLSFAVAKIESLLDEICECEFSFYALSRINCIAEQIEEIKSITKSGS